MSTSIELSAKIAEYLDKRVTLHDLEEWLAPRLTVYLANPDSQAGQLATVIELNLAEIYSGITSERTLRKVLSKYKSENPITFLDFAIDVPVNSVVATSNNPTVTSAVQSSGGVAQDQSQAWHTGVLAGAS